MATSAASLDSLSIQLRPVELEYDEDGSVIDPAEYDDAPWLKTLDYDIKLDRVKVGSLALQIIDVDELSSGFYLEMDELSSEMAEFSTALFEADGTLRSKFSREGVATWGSEVNEGELLYLQSIRVDQEYRGRGIGTKVLETIWQIPEVAESRSSFIFAWPVREPDGPGKRTSAEWEADLDRVVKLFRAAGFRRVGFTQFFCLAADARHRSKRVTAAEDGPRRKTAEEIEEERRGPPTVEWQLQFLREAAERAAAFHAR